MVRVEYLRCSCCCVAQPQWTTRLAHGSKWGGSVATVTQLVGLNRLRRLASQRVVFVISRSRSSRLVAHTGQPNRRGALAIVCMTPQFCAAPLDPCPRKFLSRRPPAGPRHAECRPPPSPACPPRRRQPHDAPPDRRAAPPARRPPAHRLSGHGPLAAARRPPLCRRPAANRMARRVPAAPRRPHGLRHGAPAAAVPPPAGARRAAHKSLPARPRAARPRTARARCPVARHLHATLALWEASFGTWVRVCWGTGCGPCRGAHLGPRAPARNRFASSDRRTPPAEEGLGDRWDYVRTGRGVEGRGARLRQECRCPQRRARQEGVRARPRARPRVRGARGRLREAGARPDVRGAVHDAGIPRHGHTGGRGDSDGGQTNEPGLFMGRGVSV